MQCFLTKGLTETASLWSDVQLGYAWVHRAAHILTNADKQTRAVVRHTYEDLLAEMEQAPTLSETLATMLSTFRKVTASYWPGLFHCYDIPDLPRTNNELEQYFGGATLSRAASNWAKAGITWLGRPWCCSSNNLCRFPSACFFWIRALSDRSHPMAYLAERTEPSSRNTAHAISLPLIARKVPCSSRRKAHQGKITNVVFFTWMCNRLRNVSV